MNNITAEAWNSILCRFNKKCAACGSANNIQRDHIIPTSRGGKDVEDNIQPLCDVCNMKKSDTVVDYRDFALRGEYLIKRTHYDNNNKKRTANLGDHLSRGEREVLEMLSSGLSTNEVADKLGVTRNAIRYHLYFAYRKLGASHRVQALRLFNEQHDAARKDGE